MPDIFDLSTLNQPPPDDAIDLSGKPKPEDVRVQLNSGIVINCEVRYDGIDPIDSTRRYLVIAEIDWENYFPTTVIVGVCPKDCGLHFRVSGVPDDVAERFARDLTVTVEKWI